MNPTPKEIYDLSIPNPYTEGTFYPVPTWPKLEAKVTFGRGRNSGTKYITLRKPCNINTVTPDGEVLNTAQGHNYFRGKYPDGEWEHIDYF